MEDLEGDGAVVPEIAGQVDGGHAATPELALEQVAVGQGGLEPFEGLGHGEIPDRDIPSLQSQPPPSQNEGGCYSAAAAGTQLCRAGSPGEPALAGRGAGG